MDALIANNELKAKAFLDEIESKKPLFMVTIATTETGKIPGLSAAGANPDFTDFTPPADAELLLLGKCKSIQGVPITPDGIPTPGLITMSALHLADIPVLVVNGGVKVKPQIPYVDLGGSSGRDIRTGNSVDNVEEVIERAKILGEQLAESVGLPGYRREHSGRHHNGAGCTVGFGRKCTRQSKQHPPRKPTQLKSRGGGGWSKSGR